jgi:hypothetical protein
MFAFFHFLISNLNYIRILKRVMIRDLQRYDYIIKTSNINDIPRSNIEAATLYP